MICGATETRNFDGGSRPAWSGCRVAKNVRSFPEYVNYLGSFFGEFTRGETVRSSALWETLRYLGEPANTDDGVLFLSGD